MRDEIREVLERFDSNDPDLVEELFNLYPTTELGKQWMIDNDEMRKVIVDLIVPAAVGRWLRKNEDYRGAQMFLGERAQFIDVNRKFWKLFHIVWEEIPPEFESEQEIKMDLIGHLLMSLYLNDPMYWHRIQFEIDRERANGQGH
jgi:hypothetical protein